jgi:hypothetical protein
MLTRTFRQTRDMIGEWRLRARSRRELAMLGEVDRHDLGCRLDARRKYTSRFGGLKRSRWQTLSKLGVDRACAIR